MFFFFSLACFLSVSNLFAFLGCVFNLFLQNKTTRKQCNAKAELLSLLLILQQSQTVRLKTAHCTLHVHLTTHDGLKMYFGKAPTFSLWRTFLGIITQKGIISSQQPPLKHFEYMLCCLVATLMSASVYQNIWCLLSVNYNPFNVFHQDQEKYLSPDKLWQTLE